MTKEVLTPREDCPQPTLFYAEDYQLEGYDDLYPLEPADQARLDRRLEQVEIHHQISESQLNHNWWYQNVLNNLEFQIKDVRADRSFTDILLDYCRQTASLNNSHIGHHILRYETRQVVRSQNKSLAAVIQEYLPGHYDYEHSRRCPWGDNSYLNLDKIPEKRLSYKHQPAVAILNSVALHATLRNAPRLRRRLKEYGKQVGHSKISLYDVMPTSFLLGRLWAVRQLKAYFEDCYQYSLPDAVAAFEESHRKVVDALRHPQMPDKSEFYLHASYYTIHQSWSNIWDVESEIRSYGLRQESVAL